MDLFRFYDDKKFPGRVKIMMSFERGFINYTGNGGFYWGEVPCSPRFTFQGCTMFYNLDYRHQKQIVLTEQSTGCEAHSGLGQQGTLKGLEDKLNIRNVTLAAITDTLKVTGIIGRTTEGGIRFLPLSVLMLNQLNILPWT